MLSLLTKAIALRDPILAGGTTDACRLLDSAPDGVPGISVDTLAGRLLIASGRTRPPDELITALRGDSYPTIYHKRLDLQDREAPVHLSGPPETEPFLILENGARFELSFSSGYSQGLFLDQRDNRHRLRDLAGPDHTVLNTFAYTGAFSIVAGLAGATTTTLDLSQPYLDWARRNFLHNQLDPAGHHFCRGDTFHWLRRFAKQGRRFNAIILDPPTFSRSDKGKVFRAEKDYRELAALALDCLAPDGTLLCCTNCRSLYPDQFERQIREASGRPLSIDPAPMPPDFRDEPYLKSLWVTR